MNEMLGNTVLLKTMYLHSVALYVRLNPGCIQVQYMLVLRLRPSKIRFQNNIDAIVIKLARIDAKFCEE